MKKILALMFLLIFSSMNVRAQISSYTAYRVYATTVAPTTCAYSATADPVVVYAGTLYVCGVGNTFVAGGGLGSVVSVGLAGTANQITVTGTSPITTSGSWTLSLPAAIALGVDNTTAGTLTLANNAAAAHTIWASGATTTNTIKGFTVTPTDGHLVTCTVSGTTCTLTDGGAVPTGTVTSSGSPGQYDFSYFTNGTNLTKVTAPTANGYYFYGANVTGSAAVAPTATVSNALPSGTAVGDSTSYFTFGSSSITPNVTITGSVSGNAGTATDLGAYTSYSVFGAGNAAKTWITPSANGQCLMSGVANYATTTPSFQTCPASGAFPAGSGSELQFRLNATTFGALPGSVTSPGGAVSLSPTGLSTPTITSVTPQTAGGGKSYAYKLVAYTGILPTDASAASTTADGEDDLSVALHGNTLAWPAQTGSTSCVLYRTAAGGATTNSTGIIATQTPCLPGYTDIGAAGAGEIPPTVNYTAGFGVAGPITFNQYINSPNGTYIFNSSAGFPLEITVKGAGGASEVGINPDINGTSNTNSGLTLSASDNSTNFLRLGDMAGNLDWIGTTNITLDDGSGDTSPGVKLLGWGIGAITFTGAGLNDMVTAGFMLGTNPLAYCVQIDGTAPDTFKWGTDNCASWLFTGVPITGTVQPLSNGVSVWFLNVLGHTLADNWAFPVAASPGDGYEFNASDADTPVTEGATCTNVGDQAGARAIYLRGDLKCF
jgi:hypothetical protein